VTTNTAQLPSISTGAPVGLPRLLATHPHSKGAVDLPRHRSTMAPPPPVHRRPRFDLIDAVEAAGLRGRGGGAFPTATKMRAVVEAGRSPVVVVNGAEGEPASSKDRLLMTRMPHLVLDGALIGAAAVGASEVIVCIERTSGPALAAMEAAIEERSRAERRPLPMRVLAIPPRFVAGEESALVHFINGGEAKPTRTPPRVFQRGVDNRPTLLSNAETFAHVAQITQWGPTWFRQFGTRDEPGTMLATISGDVVHPGVCEMAIDTPLVDAIRAAGGTRSPIQALLIGGYYGTWIGAADAAAGRLSNADLRPRGSGVGCGAVVVLPTGACGLRETARVLTWMSTESAGQCGPCVHGLGALAGGMTALASGRGQPTTLGDLQRWAGLIDKRGACSFPDGAARLLRSTLTVFADDISHHLRHGVCVGTKKPPTLRLPKREAVVWR
jgi:NADH:ubiquinone oxidoreductase subunit F (NADH-binding)